MIGETVTRLEKIIAPYGREVMLDDVVYDSGMRLLRITVKEGQRITILNIDSETAAHWGSSLADWAKRVESANQ